MEAAAAERRLAVFTIVEREGQDRSLWRRVGSAYVNRDGSYNIFLEALPVNGRLHLREVEINNKSGEGRKEGEP